MVERPKTWLEIVVGEYEDALQVAEADLEKAKRDVILWQCRVDVAQEILAKLVKEGA